MPVSTVLHWIVVPLSATGHSLVVVQYFPIPIALPLLSGSPQLRPRFAAGAAEPASVSLLLPFRQLAPVSAHDITMTIRT